MTKLETTKELIIGLLKIGGTPNIEALFELLVKEAPYLVGAEECSIFWRDGAWRKEFKNKLEKEYTDSFYRRATYAKKKHLIGKEFYRTGEGLTGWVAKHGKTLRIDDITEKKQLEKISPDLKWEDKGKGFQNSVDKDQQRAFLAVPIKIEGEVIGIIRISKTIKPFGKFTKQSQNLLEIFAEHVAAIIMHVEEMGLKNLWEKLYLSGISFHKDEFLKYLQQVANEIPKYLGAQACSIFLLEFYTKPQLRLQATTEGGPLEHKVGQATYDIGEGLTGWVAKNNKSLCIKDVDNEDELKLLGINIMHIGKHEEYIKKHSSFLASPISMEETVFGVIRIAKDSAGNFFSSTDQLLVEYFCKNLAVLVQNVQLFKQTELEKDNALARLKINQKELEKLGKLFKEDVANIQKSLSEIIPKLEDETFKKIGPIIIENKQRDMKMVFIGIPFSAHYKNVYNFAILPALEKVKLTPWIAFEEKSVIAIMRKVFNGIQQSHIGIVDISEWNPNVLLELGVLYGQNHPVILLKQEDSKVPADLAGLEYIQYGDFTLLKENLIQHLNALMSACK
jgi:GAF domain-containing protein